MGWMLTCCVIGSICILILIVNRCDSKYQLTALRALDSDFAFCAHDDEHEDGHIVARRMAPANKSKQKRYVSPLMKKRIAARQKWLCNLCKGLLDETFEIEHFRPLFKGSDGDLNHESNLQALCRSCHMKKSAQESTY